MERPPWVGLDPPAASAATSSALADMHGDGGSVNDHLRREIAAAGGESTTLRVSGAAAASVDAYIEYRRVVGNADGGVMFTGARSWLRRSSVHGPRRRGACSAQRERERARAHSAADA